MSHISQGFLHSSTERVSSYCFEIPQSKDAAQRQLHYLEIIVFTLFSLPYYLGLFPLYLTDDLTMTELSKDWISWVFCKSEQNGMVGTQGRGSGCSKL